MDEFHEVERPRIEDFLFKASKMAVGLIPVAGPVLSEVFSYAISDPIQARTNQFVADLNNRVVWLEENRGVETAELLQNDLFLDIVIQATSFATKTSETDKRKALINSITNTALNLNPDEVKTRIFVRVIDSLTGWHLKVLYFINNPKRCFTDLNKPIPEYYQTSIFSVLKHVYPEFSDQDDLIDIIWSDLHSAGFHRSGSIKSGMSGDGVLSERTTDLGKEFMRFITFNEE
jgi:hypothetical protein